MARLDETGILVLMLPGQQELTKQQYHWSYRHSEITGYETSFSLVAPGMNIEPAQDSDHQQEHEEESFKNLL